MNGIMYMVQQLMGAKMTMPVLGVLIAECRNNKPCWVIPKVKGHRGRPKSGGTSSAKPH